MTTKLNSRSPFYLTITEPSDVLGAYDCEDASGIAGQTSLQGMVITADGTISDPVVANGGTVDSRSPLKFNTNSTGSDIPNQSVTFNIRVPQGYTNHNAIISCTATATQPSTASNNCNTSTSKPIYSGTIPNITNLTDNTAQTISLGSFFSNGSTGAITTYQLEPQDLFSRMVITSSGSGANQTFSFRNSGNSGTYTATFIAHNSLDGCTTSSLPFTIGLLAGGGGSTGNQTLTLTCTTDDATNDAVNANVDLAQDGTLSNARGNADFSHFEFPSGSGTTVTSLDANNTTSAINVTLDMVFNVPNGYDNPSSTITCPVTVEQLGTQLRAFTCTDIRVSGFDITSGGNILTAQGRVRFGATELTFSNVRPSTGGQKFDISSSVVLRTILFDFTIPSGFSDSGQTKTDCSVQVNQPADTNPCASVDTTDIGIQFFLARQSFSNKASYCTGKRQYDCDFRVFLPTDLHVGATVCDGNSTFDGGNQFYGIKRRQPGIVGGNSGVFTVVRINNEGQINAVESVNCGNTTDPFDPIL